MFFIISKKLRRQLLFVILLVILAVELPIITAGFLTQPQSGDVIIILGAKLIGSEPSTMLRLRLEEGLRLYRLGYAPAFIVSGAQGKDEEISEARAMKQYLINQGVEEERILIEDQSFNTYQNLVNSQKIMNQQGMKKSIIVSNSSHIRRALLIAHNLQMNATDSAAPMADNEYLTTKQYLREGAAMAYILFLPK